MQYFQVLNLQREPFSNSPDPEFFFQSRRHVGCLQKLELSIRLRRGLSVVVGEVGTGKTTLCRQLIRRFARDPGVETHLILDPLFPSSRDFLKALSSMFGLPRTSEGEPSEWRIKDEIQKHLFRRGVEEGKIVVLILDEGQKIPRDCLEVLRELLNYEVNQYKLLQIVLFAQKEFEEVLSQHKNFADRINFYGSLGPFGFGEMKAMILFRLGRAKEGFSTPRLFTFWGFVALYRATGGYPRKVVHLCHRTLMTLIVQNRSIAGWSTVRWSARMIFRRERRSRAWAVALAGLLTAGAALLWAFGGSGPATGWKAAGLGGLKALGLLSTKTGTEAAKPHAPGPGETSSPAKNPHGPSPPSQSPPSGTPEVSPGVSPPTGRASEPEAPGTQAAGEAGGRSSRQTESVSGRSAGLASPGEATAPARPPDSLGPLTVPPGTTLSELVRLVYGSSDALILQAVKGANPHIREVSVIGAGKTIVFPAALAPVSWPEGRYLVALAVRDSLEECFRCLVRHPKDGPAVRICPFWSPEDGLRFALVFKESFSSEGTAAAFIGGLPPAMGRDSRILGNRTQETLVFGRW